MHQRQKRYLVYFITLVFVCLLIVAAVWFLFHKLNQAAKQIQKTKTDLVIWQKKEAYFRQLSEEQERLHDDLSRINQGFLNPERLVSFIENLEDLAHQAQVSQEINSAVQQPDKPASLKVDLVLVGNFPALLHYLVLLENMNYYSKVTKVQIIQMQQAPSWSSELGALPSLNTLKVNLELIVFLTPSPETQAKTKL